jgi:hypothetical protein
MTGNRFREPDAGSGMMALPWLVRCPRCSAKAIATVGESNAHRLTCGSCGLAREGAFALLAGRGSVAQETTTRGPWRRDRTPRQHWPERAVQVIDLWLRADIGDHVLWATNEQHLDYLDRYIAADLREGCHTPTQDLHHQLPTWMKDAKQRDRLVAAIREMRESL